MVCCLEAEAEHDALAAAMWQREQEALANLPAGLSGATDRYPVTPASQYGWCFSIGRDCWLPSSEALPLPVTNILYTPERLITLWPGR